MLRASSFLPICVLFVAARSLLSVPAYTNVMHRVLLNKSDLPSGAKAKEAPPSLPEKKDATPGTFADLYSGVLPGVLPVNYPEISPDSLPPVPKAEKETVDTKTKPTSNKSCLKTPLYGVCDMKPNPNIPSNINGTIYLRQDVTSNCKHDFLNIQVNIDSVPIDDGTTKHGFHIHEFGDMTGGCETMGPHFNPFGAKHGAPWNKADSRHVGDLGNVVQRGRRGSISTRLVDFLAKLYGEISIYGRGLVLHAKKDDLGLGGNPGSEATGNAGKRLACCVIVKAPPHSRDLYSMY